MEDIMITTSRMVSHPAPLIEQGSAFVALEGREIGRREAGQAKEERHDVIVIGAGQAGLSAGYHLVRAKADFLILEAGERIGDQWRRRWDSLRLFTPAKFDGLDGMKFPAHPDAFPTKDEMADYLESYADHFRLPVRLGSPVGALEKQGDDYVVTANGRRYVARQVIVAAASYQKPRVPEFASKLAPEIVQLHSHEYKNPSQLRDGPVLLVGAGNSGAEIAMDLAPDHQIWLSGRDVGAIPFRIEGFLGRKLLVRIVVRGLFHRVLTVATPVGRKFRPFFLSHGGPLIRTKPRDLAKAGVKRVGRIAGVENGRPRLENGRTLDVANVIWCTGFQPGLSWIKLPIFDDNGHPRQDRGIVAGAPGLYFVGLHFLYSPSSTMIHGVGRDAKRVVRAAMGNMARTKSAGGLEPQAA
jgi:putative flavoprotein involved in K+ transport